MKQIVAQTPSNVISLNNVQFGRCFIIQVYENKVKLLVNGIHHKGVSGSGFVAFDTSTMNSARTNLEGGTKESVALNLELDSTRVKIYQFETLKDFCQVALNEGWEI